MTKHPDWDDMAAMEQAGKLDPIPGTERRGEDAAAHARELLMNATATDNIDDAARIAIGRPRLSDDNRETVTWKVRATAVLDDLAGDLAQRQGKTRSALIRDAVAEYVRNHAAAPDAHTGAPQDGRLR